MNPDEFPTDQNRIIAQLERRIAALEARVGTTQGAPVLQASGAFFVPNSSAPSPSGGASLYAVGGQLRWTSSSGGDYSLLPATLPRGSAVAGPPNLFSSSPAPSSYSSTHSTDMARDINNINLTLGALLTSLRNAPIINT